MKKTEEIGLRDPYILVHEGKYYMYGTRNYSVWGPADGFDVYVSEDLNNWEGPIEIFHRPEGFWATENYWAPECIYHEGMFYLITTLGNPSRTKGIQILKSKSPMGPFTCITDGPITPEKWNCIDGTVYNDDGTLWLVFSYGLPDEKRGAMCAARLKEDFTGLEGEPVTMFYAMDAPWANPIPFAKAEFGLDGDVYFSDGPFLYKENGQLKMIWSSWSEGGYAVGEAVSESGMVQGPWIHGEKPLHDDGGHGMIFETKEGQRKLTIHFPNETPKERAVFIDL